MTNNLRLSSEINIFHEAILQRQRKKNIFLFMTAVLPVTRNITKNKSTYPNSPWQAQKANKKSPAWILTNTGEILSPDNYKSFKFIFYASCLYDPSFSKTSSTLTSLWKMCLHGPSCNSLEQLRNKNAHSVVMSLNPAGECVWWVDFSSNSILCKIVRAGLQLSERSSKAQLCFLCPKNTSSAASLAAIWPPVSIVLGTAE